MVLDFFFPFLSHMVMKMVQYIFLGISIEIEILISWQPDLILENKLSKRWKYNIMCQAVLTPCEDVYNTFLKSYLKGDTPVQKSIV